MTINKPRYQIMAGPTVDGQVTWALVDTQSTVLDNCIIYVSNNRDWLKHQLCRIAAKSEYSTPERDIFIELHNN